jgi:hypothetical protein
MLTCPFCKEEVEKFHKRSHLVPEWMYTDCYNENHKVIEVVRSEEKVTKKQKGVYGSFICTNCEKETQKYDHYASLILTNKSPETDEYKSVKRTYYNDNHQGEKLEVGVWENIDFKKLQNFIYSIVLRTHFAGRIKGPIALNSKHLERILASYKNEAILDDSSYPILVVEYHKNDKMRNHVILPFIKKIESHHIIEFTGGGYAFNIYVSSHPKPHHVRSLRLKKDGRLLLINIFFQETALGKKSLKLIGTLGKAKDK